MAESRHPVRTRYSRSNEIFVSDLACKIILEAVTGNLGTVDQHGCPFVSLVTVAATNPTEVILLLSGLAKHTKHLTENHHGALMFVAANEPSADPLAVVRVTVRGSVERITSDHAARAAFLQRHPSASVYADFDDFNFYRLKVAKAYIVAGFGHIETIPAAKLVHSPSD